MKVIIAGGRGNHDRGVVEIAVKASHFSITEIVSGGAAGVDTSGEIWARKNRIKLTRFPADWTKYGPKAGPLRNGKMADYAEALIAIWDGHSDGTRDMIDQATGRLLHIYIHRI